MNIFYHLHSTDKHIFEWIMGDFPRRKPSNILYYFIISLHWSGKYIHVIFSICQLPNCQKKKTPKKTHTPKDSSYTGILKDKACLFIFYLISYSFFLNLEFHRKLQNRTEHFVMLPVTIGSYGRIVDTYSACAD